MSKAIKLEINPFCRLRANLNKTWLSKLGCYGTVNFDVHVTATLKCSQIIFKEKPLSFLSFSKGGLKKPPV